MDPPRKAAAVGGCCAKTADRCCICANDRATAAFVVAAAELTLDK